MSDADHQNQSRQSVEVNSSYNIQFIKLRAGLFLGAITIVLLGVAFKHPSAGNAFTALLLLFITTGICTMQVGYIFKPDKYRGFYKVYGLYFGKWKPVPSIIDNITVYSNVSRNNRVFYHVAVKYDDNISSYNNVYRGTNMEYAKEKGNKLAGILNVPCNEHIRQQQRL